MKRSPLKRSPGDGVRAVSELHRRIHAAQQRPKRRRAALAIGPTSQAYRELDHKLLHLIHAGHGDEEKLARVTGASLRRVRAGCRRLWKDGLVAPGYQQWSPAGQPGTEAPR